DPDEILTEIKVPFLSENTFGAYLRFCPGERPTAGVAALVTFAARGCIEDVVLTLGCVNPRPIRAVEAESILRGQTLNEALTCLEQAGEAGARVCNPVDDLRGSIEYKRHIVKVLIKRVFRLACRRSGLL
ncbi:MAG: carbon monoxide dehydrogenase, partial [Acidobacteria bacterium]